jgi:acylphosphatase
MPVKTRINISGNVQGIGYRYFVAKLAAEMKLKGYVRNKNDGSVELELECDDSQLEVILRRLKTGHPWARVDSVKTTNAPFEGVYSSFEIRD